MKKIIQRFLSFALTLAMLSGILVMPSFAAQTAATPAACYVDANFNSQSVGGSYSSANSFPGKVSGVSGENAYATSDGVKDAFTFFDRDSSEAIDIAMRMGTTRKYSTKHTVKTQFWKSNTLVKSDGNVLRINVDMLVEDKSCDKIVNFRPSTNGTSGSFLPIIKFDTAGNIYIWDKLWKSYSVNTWYNIELYYDCGTNMVYFYSDDKLVDVFEDTTKFHNVDTFFQFNINATIPANTIDAVSIDNLFVGMYNKSDFSNTEVGGLENYLYVDNNYPAANKNISSILYAFNSQHTTNRTGIFGKSSTDKSLNMYYSGSGNLTNLDITPSSFLTNGEILHISSLMGFSDGSAATKKIVLQGATTRSSLMEIAATGSVNVLGNSLDTMNSNQWYRYDFIITTSGDDYSVDVYVNGVLKKENITGTNSGFTSRFRHVLSGTKANVADDGMWIDNTLVAAYASDATPIVPSVTITNSNVTTEGVDTIYVPETYTVSDFTANTTASMPYEIRTKAGATVANSALLVGNFVVFKPAIGGEIYYEVKAARDASYNFKSTYDRTNDDALTLTGGTSEIKEAGYGRDTNANYVTLGTDGTAKLVSSFYSKLATTTAGTTLELDILTPANTNGMVEPFVAWRDQDGYRRPLVRFGVGGDIQLVKYPGDKIANETIENTGLKWEPNRWYHISAWLPNNYGEARVYVNGKHVHNVPTAGSNTNMNYIGIRATGAGSTFALDNIMVYDGNYESVAVQDKVVYSSRLVDNENRVIYLPSSFVGQDAWSYFDKNVVIYKDSTLNEQIEATDVYILTGNENIIVTSPSGKSIGYYTVDSEDNAEIFGIKQNGVYVTGGDVPSDGGVLSVKVYNEASYIIIAAQYDINGEMVSLATSENGHDEIVNIGIDDEASEIKFMCLDSLGTIKPLKLAKVLGVLRTTEE